MRPWPHVRALTAQLSPGPLPRSPPDRMACPAAASRPRVAGSTWSASAGAANVPAVGPRALLRW